MPNKTVKDMQVTSAQKVRPPVVVVMGHVDHGKTTLLDYIRKANIASREAGGITQAVGAYEIEHRASGSNEVRKITFIDTPGHEAFTAMRARGAQAADLAILVVAADEGVKPQTKEAIKILEDSKTPFIVAMNKMDKTGGTMDKAIGDLMTAGVMLEGYGGQVSYHGVSAKTGEGVDELLDLVLLAADLENLSYSPAVPASGFVLEARRDPRRGIEATVIVKNGTLHRGDVIATATAGGKVKILENFLGKVSQELEPSAPALIIGFETFPKVGEEFIIGGTPTAAVRTAGSLNRQPKPNTLHLILKASDAGSLEALRVVLSHVHGEGGKEIEIIEDGVGDITDGDVRHAQATSSTIIGFKNRVEKGAKVLADAQSVTIITSEIVYDLADSVKDFLTGVRGPAIAGELEVLAVFNQEKQDKQLVGGRVIRGTFREKSSFDIARGAGQEIVGNGRILGLRERKDEITHAEEGKEIGVLANAPLTLQVGDRLIIRK